MTRPQWSLGLACRRFAPGVGLAPGAGHLALGPGCPLALLLAPLVLLLALVGCAQTPHAGGETHQLMGTLSGSAARGVFVAEHVAALADQVERGTATVAADVALAGKIRAINTKEAFGYGFSYDGCSHSNPDLVVVSPGVIEARTDDLNRECVRAMPLTVYFSVPWAEVGDTFTIGVVGDPHPVRVQDRVVS